MNKTTLSVFVLGFSFITSVVAGDFTTGNRVNRMSVPFNTPVVKSLGNPDIPVTKEATNVTNNGFTANWETVRGAAGYGLYSIRTHTAIVDEAYKIVHEDFDKISQGTLDKPYENMEVDKEYWDDYTNVCDWLTMFGAQAKGMLGLSNMWASLGAQPGILVSPFIDLSHDNGKFFVDLKIIGLGMSKVIVQYYNEKGIAETVQKTLTNSMQELRLEFTKGVSKGHIRIQGEGSGYLLIDELAVIQNLKAGESVNQNYSIKDVNAPSTSCYFETPNKLSNDGFSFMVCAYDDYGYSEFSEPHAVNYAADIKSQSTDGIKVYANDCLNVETAESTSIQIYSSTGVCVASVQSEEGVNQIPLIDKGVYMVKVGDRLFKIIR